MLVALSGLPGVGKTTIARELARRTAALHLRIDSIEQALRNCGLEVQGEGYAVAYAIAEDNLRLGRIVIADCVDPWPLTRAAWRAVAERAGVRILPVEIVCSAVEEHRRRVESRVADLPGHEVPTWADVLARDYQPRDDQCLVVDTAGTDVSVSVDTIIRAMNLPASGVTASPSS